MTAPGAWAKRMLFWGIELNCWQGGLSRISSNLSVRLAGETFTGQPVALIDFVAEEDTSDGQLQMSRSTLSTTREPR
jgi:hypothetical protein